MIAGSTFTNIVGLVPAGDPDRIAKIARAACKAGWAVVVNRPGQKIPMCIFTARQSSAADRAAREAAQAAGDTHAGRRRHACGLAHAITDPERAQRVVTRLVSEAGHVNLGLELGASRLVAVDVDTAAQNAAFLVAWSARTGRDETVRGPTVRSPGALDSAGRRVHSDGGHYWFSLPDGCVLPTEPGVLRGEGDWSAMWARRQVLIPPSVRPEGAYQLVGLGEVAPAWLIKLIYAEADARAKRAGAQRGEAFSSADPLERWSAALSWNTVLPGYGWLDTGLIDGCGCPVWTAPGEHASPKSATAHEAGCARYDTGTGWGPLHLWTDHAPQELAGARTFTKLNFLTAMEYHGDVTAAMRELGLLDAPPDLSTPAPDVELDELVVQGIPGRRLVVTMADRIATGRVRWAWQDRMPLGELTLIPGREGIGKSLFVAWLTAQLTRGTLPGAFYGTPRAVLYVASEDSWRYTIVPRMVAAGADLSLLGKVAIAADERDDRLILPADCDRVADTAIEMNAAALMLDPIISLIDDRLSVNQARELRKALEPLRQLAERAQIMVAALAHFNKTNDVDTLSKIPGARAWVEVARAAFGLAEDREAGPGSYVASQIKNNLGRLTLPHLSYRIESTAVATSEGETDVGRLVWTGESDVGVDEVLSRRPERHGREVSDTTKMIIGYVHGEGTPVDLEAVYGAFPEVKRETVRTILRRAVEKGTVSNPSPRRYAASFTSGVSP